MDWFGKRKRLISSVLIILVCIGLFLPWGEAGFGGEIRIGESYSNPVWVKGSYPRGAAGSLKEFSDELQGFQRECEWMELMVTVVLIFLAVLELAYAVCTLTGLEAGHYIGIVAEILVLAVLAAGIILALAYGDSTIKLGKYVRVVTEIHLNGIPFLLVLLEIAGKHVCSVKKFD